MAEENERPGKSTFVGWRVGAWRLVFLVALQVSAATVVGIPRRRAAGAGLEGNQRLLTLIIWQKSLTFRRDCVVELRDDVMGRGKAHLGTWAYDAELGHFRTVIYQEFAAYFLMRLNDDSICVLASGSPTAANLETAWFARILRSAVSAKSAPLALHQPSAMRFQCDPSPVAVAVVSDR